MRLTVPTDFDILDAFADGRRNNAANLAHELDRNRSYINTRLPVLADYGLLERVGPAPKSGLYAITEKGLAAAEHRDDYRTDGVDFDALVDQAVEASSSSSRPASPADD
ncbi:ArsR family transcriptional regulator [Halobellus ruber]|uniref:ArsR family transcriptional regulator n=1 Tax=Halobellus ruber TaxID=2761102 RepID=A0A7J9SHQ2_9EURY|nr:ArsR family transcriptional regulator [Halobellus ruber]MBB6646495.1 ArsR family transcriptional regulator [Halobellus ruber]